MKRALLLVTIVVAACLLAPPVWAENPESDEIQALRQELMELKGLLQSQQKQILEQEKKFQEQDFRMLGLEESVVEPTPYEEVGGMHVEEVIERVKAELAPAGDGFTIGGGKIRVTPYGFLRLDMAYDDSEILTDKGNLVIWVNPEGSGSDDDEMFSVAATATRLGFNFDGPEFEGGKVRGKLEFDFDEGGNLTTSRIRMRHAYAELVYPDWSLLAGQTWDVFGPRIPYMLDCMVMWYSGNVGYRRPQLRLTKYCELEDAKITSQIALTTPDRTSGDDVDSDGIRDGSDSGLPMLQGRLGVDIEVFEGRKLGLGISGAIGEEEADSLTAGDDEDTDVWIVVLDGKVTVVPGFLTVQGEIWTGENVDELMGGISQGVTRSVTDVDEIEAYGGFIHAMLTPRKDLKFNVGYGIDEVDRNDLAGSGRKSNETVFGNVIWTVVPNFDVGLEVAYHETEYEGSDDGDDFRVQTAFIYKF